MAGGILMYMFIFIYGAQIMQGIIEEKTSKVVEVIVSSVKPFQLMMGKILGLASVGLLQFLIWIILMSTLTFGVLGFFGIDRPWSHEWFFSPAGSHRKTEKQGDRVQGFGWG
jgi:ABC-2 type transport system permease protein